MADIHLNDYELTNLLEHQVRLLKHYCAQFDSGEHYFYSEIATKLRVLLYQSKGSNPILFAVNSEANIFYSSVQMLMEVVDYDVNNFSYKNILESSNLKAITFSNWWNDECMKNKSQESFSRKDIISGVANKFGGAHVDKVIPSKFYDIDRNNSMFKWLEIVPNPEVQKAPVYESPLPFIVRQIAHEFLHSYKNGFS